jgi:cytochrome c
MQAFSYGVVVFAVSCLLCGAPAFSEGDLERGAKVFMLRCISCHSMECTRRGPRLGDLVGRPAGTEPGFAYSDAMAKSGIVWDEDALDAFLADMNGVIPGNGMWSVTGNITDPEDRRSLIDYLLSGDTSLDIC